MARRHFDGDGASARVDDGVDFRGAAAARASNRLRFRPPFSARRRAVSLGRRAGDGLTIAGIGARQRVK